MIKKKLTESDISEVTKIHLLAFNDFFLSTMGDGFLKLYYKCFLKDKNGFGVGIFDGEGILMGFSVATTKSKGFNRNLIINNFSPFFIIGMKILFTKPKSLYRLIKNMKKKINRTIDDEDYAELFSIAVDPKNQGLGIGKLLLREVEKTAFEKGCLRITLTTDFFNNTNVINFYIKMGYAVFYDFTTYPNRRMYKMIKILN